MAGGTPRENDIFNALGHSLRREILRTMLAGGLEISPRELSEKLEKPLSALSYHVRVLAECDAVELVRTRQIRGSTQHFYRATVKDAWALTALEASHVRRRRRRRRGEEKG